MLHWIFMSFYSIPWIGGSVRIFHSTDCTECSEICFQCNVLVHTHTWRDTHKYLIQNVNPKYWNSRRREANLHWNICWSNLLLHTFSMFFFNCIYFFSAKMSWRCETTNWWYHLHIHLHKYKEGTRTRHTCREIACSLNAFQTRTVVSVLSTLFLSFNYRW